MLKFNPTRTNAIARAFSVRLERVGKQAVRKTFFDMGTQMKKEAQHNILHGKKTGRIYVVRLGKRRKFHQASAAGEAPANLTGRLRRSVSYRITASDKIEFGYSDDTPYGKWLENGTPAMGKRPNIVPVATRIHTKARTYFFKNLKREVMRMHNEIR